MMRRQVVAICHRVRQLAKQSLRVAGRCIGPGYGRATAGLLLPTASPGWQVAMVAFCYSNRYQ
jgi:hypothetical protein